MTLRFIDFKTSEPQPATSPLVVSPGLKDAGSNHFLRQAQGLSLSKAAESNFEEHIRFEIQTMKYKATEVSLLKPLNPEL